MEDQAGEGCSGSVVISPTWWACLTSGRILWALLGSLTWRAPPARLYPQSTEQMKQGRDRQHEVVAERRGTVHSPPNPDTFYRLTHVHTTSPQTQIPTHTPITHTDTHMLTPTARHLHRNTSRCTRTATGHSRRHRPSHRLTCLPTPLHLSQNTHSHFPGWQFGPLSPSPRAI